MGEVNGQWLVDFATEPVRLCKSHNQRRSVVSLQMTQPRQINCFFENQTTYADQLFLCKSNNLCRSAVSLQITQPTQINCFFANHKTYADQLFLCKSHNLRRSAVYLQITQDRSLLLVQNVKRHSGCVICKETSDLGRRFKD